MCKVSDLVCFFCLSLIVVLVGVISSRGNILGIYLFYTFLNCPFFFPYKPTPPFPLRLPAIFRFEKVLVSRLVD